MIETLTAIAANDKETWSVKELKCDYSSMELVGGPNGAPFTHKEFNNCALTVNGIPLHLEGAQAKSLISALNIKWIQDRASRDYIHLSLADLECTSRTTRFGVFNQCSGRK